MKKAATVWVRKAEVDHLAAARLAGDAGPFHDVVSFLCQQSAEKYLKALLVEHGLAVPKTHDLERLLALLFPNFPRWFHCGAGLPFLPTLQLTRAIRATTPASARPRPPCAGPSGLGRRPRRCSASVRPGCGAGSRCESAAATDCLRPSGATPQRWPTADCTRAVRQEAAWPTRGASAG